MSHQETVNCNDIFMLPARSFFIIMSLDKGIHGITPAFQTAEYLYSHQGLLAAPSSPAYRAP